MRQLVVVFFLFTFLSLLLFWPIFWGKVNLNGNLLVSFYPPYGQNLPYKNSGWDQLRIYFPFYKVTLDSIKNFEIPLWNPYAFSGHPHLADFQTAVFYPLNIFGLFLSQIEFWHLLRVTPAILAAFFTFLYLRALRPFDYAQGQLSNLASLFGSLAFGFSPFILTWGEEVVQSPHSIVWMPLILYAIEKFLDSQAHPRGVLLEPTRLHPGGGPGRFYLAIISLASAFSFFGGYMQTTVYMFVFVGAYLAFRILHLEGVKAHLRGVLMLLGAFVLGTTLAAVQLLPSAELFFNAARSQITLREQLFNFLLPIESILTFFTPDFFGHPATANFFRFGDAQYYEGILFVGVAALVFAAYSLLTSFAHLGGIKALRYNSGQAHPRGDSQFVKFLAISGVVALLTTIDWFGAKLFFSLPIPFLSTSIPNRILFIPAFCLAVLAAGGLDRWHKEQFQIFKSVLVIAGVYCGILVTLVLVKIFGISYFEHKQFFSEVNLLVSLRNLVIPLLVFATTVVLIAAAALHWFSKQTAAMLIITVAFVHIFYFSQKYFSFSDSSYVFAQNDVLKFIDENQGLYRSWGIGDAFFENNFASQYSLYWPEGYDSLNNRSYGEFTYAMQGANLGDFVFRADAGLGRGSTAELIENPNRRRLIDLVGVKYVIGHINDTELMEKNGFRKVYDPSADLGFTPGESKPTPGVLPDEARLAVFENLTVAPRAFLASNYEGPPDVFGEEPETVKEKSQREKLRRGLISQKLLSEDFDWRNVLILEKPSPVSAQFGEGTAEITSYKNHEVIVKTRSDEPKLLFLSDNWYPGWKATVDGDETEILRANYTFRAVPLIAGEHEVRFYYDSMLFKLGLGISLASFLILAYLTLVRNRLVR